MSKVRNVNDASNNNNDDDKTVTFNTNDSTSIMNENIESNRLIESWLKDFDREVLVKLSHLDDEYSRCLDKIRDAMFVHTQPLVEKMGEMTIAEVRRKGLSATTFLSDTNNSIAQISESNGLLKLRPKENEDSTLTSSTVSNESTRTGGRRTRLRSKSSGGIRNSSVSKPDTSSATTTASKRNNRRVSRSVSRTRHQLKKNPIGLITPKVQANAPITILRHPMQGELAMSMQGSPLVVSRIVSEECANVNIPLQDGRVMLLQPKHGLRASQIPPLDTDTKAELKTLRDNIDKMMQLAADIP